MKKGIIIGLIFGMAVPPVFAAIQVGFNLENGLFRDICAMSAMSALIIKYGKTPSTELDSFQIADKMVRQRNSK